MDRSLKDTIALVLEVKAAYAKMTAAKDTAHPHTTADTIAEIQAFLGIFVQHNVTLEELLDLIGVVGPLLA